MNKCSICGATEGVQPASVIAENRIAKLELCPEHLEPLLQYVKPELSIPYRKPRSVRSKRLNVVTIDEIEKMKAS